MHEVSPSGFFGGTPGLKLMWTVRDAEHIVILISIAGGLFCARVWSVVAVTAIAALLFPTLLTLFVSPDWKRLGFERYFEMQAGNFIALAAITW